MSNRKKTPPEKQYYGAFKLLKTRIFEIVNKLYPRAFLFLFMLPLFLGGQQGILYELTGKNMKRSYLLAGNPFADEHNFDFSDSVFAAFDRSEQFVTLHANDSAFWAEAKRQTLPGPKIKAYDLLNNQYFGKADQLIHSINGASFWEYEDWSPLFLQIRLEQWSKTQHPEGGQRSFFQTLTRYQKKEEKSLLSASEYADLINQIPLEWQADMLAYFVQLSEENDYAKRFVNQYLSEDIDGCYRVEQSYRHAVRLYLLRPAVIRKAAQKIRPLSARHASFFFIEASLLGGPAGLLSQMEKEGIHVRPIRPGMEKKKNQNSGAPFPFFHDSLLYRPGLPLAYYHPGDETDTLQAGQVLEGWYQLTSYRGGFSVRMPGPPEVVIDQLPREAGGMTMYLYRYEDADKRQLYIVSFFDYPRELTPDGDDEYFNALIAQSVQHFNGLLLKEEKISSSQFAGREIQLSTDDGQILRIRFYLIGRRLYQVILGAEDLKAFSVQNEAYFASFRLLNVYKNPWLPIQTAAITFSLPRTPQVYMHYLPFRDTTASVLTIEEKSEETGLQYSATLSLLPDRYKLKNTTDVYQRMAYAAIRSIDGVLVSENFSENKDFRLFYMEAGGKEEQLQGNRFFINHAMIIHLMVSGPEGSVESAFARRFLNGYRLKPFYR